jgi:hypothetical protein
VAPFLALALTLSAPWKAVAPGVEVAPASELGGDGAWAARVLLVDPSAARFAVRYDPARPTLPEWRKRFPQALAIANGSFYSLEGEQVRPTCDLVADGAAVKGAGCHRSDALYFGARLRAEPPKTSLVSREQPRLLLPADFKPEQWSEALKSFPALVRDGASACAGPHYCAESSRTAALAQMKDGRILLFASQWPAVRREVGKWLAEELGAVTALNLDGGPEATLAIKDEPAEDAIGTLGVGLPMVLLVLPR